MCRIDDIKGYKREVERLRNVCDFLKNTNKYTDFGVKLPHGLLICGRKGVGKTMMAEALAHDCERQIFHVDVNERNSKRIERTFKMARKSDRAIVVIDDVDYLNLNDEDDEEFLKQIDYEMYRCKESDVFVVVTADDKENLPKYLLGNFDFDMIIELDSPTIEEACVIFKPIFDKYALDDDFDSKDFCCFAVDCTYTDVEFIFNNAARMAISECSERISMRHLIQAGLCLKDYEPATEFDVATAYHEVGHAVVNLLLGGDAACIVLYGNSGGYFEEKTWYRDTYRDIERRYMVRVAGKACEEIFTDSVAIGSQKDLQRAAEEIENYLKVYGVQGFEYFSPTELDSPAYNDALMKKVQAELQKYYDKAKELLAANKVLVEKFVGKLKEKFYMLHSEIYEIFDKYKSEK